MKNKTFIILIIVLTVIYAVSLYFCVNEFFEDHKQVRKFESVAQLIDTTQNNCFENERNEKQSLNYKDLYNQNKDFIGWIKIDNTSINYPVMQSKDQPNFYIKHNFNKQYSRLGVPFIQENCNLDSDNIIIYGHNMKNKTMFNDLLKFESKKFYENNKYINFDTLDNHNIYEIVAVFKTDVNSENMFKYYRFVNTNSEEEFSAYIEKCKALSLYDTNVSANYGDKLITLSTCEYSQKNGRFVVVAKKI